MHPLKAKKMSVDDVISAFQSADPDIKTLYNTWNATGAKPSSDYPAPGFSIGSPIVILDNTGRHTDCLFGIVSNVNASGNIKIILIPSKKYNNVNHLQNSYWECVPDWDNYKTNGQIEKVLVRWSVKKSTYNLHPNYGSYSNISNYDPSVTYNLMD